MVTLQPKSNKAMGLIWVELASVSVRGSSGCSGFPHKFKKHTYTNVG